MYNVVEMLASAVNLAKAGRVYLINRQVYRDKLVDHFKKLNVEDRRMRFGVILGNDRICHYVDDQIKDNDSIFAIFNEQGEIVAVLHMAAERNDNFAYEFGLSVNEDYRKNGYASSLFSKAVQHAKTLGAKRIYTYCLGENKAMQSLAKKNDLKVMLEYGDVTGELVLKERSAPEIVRDLVDFVNTENMMIFDRVSDRYVNTLLGQYRYFENLASSFVDIYGLQNKGLLFRSVDYNLSN